MPTTIAKTKSPLPTMFVTVLRLWEAKWPGPG